MLTGARLAHASFLTANLEGTIEFYSRHFGATISHEFVSPTGERYGVFLELAAGTSLEFFNAQQELHAGNVFRHVCLKVPDLDAAVAHFEQAGFTIEVKVGKTDRVRQFFISDPNGIQIEFHEERAPTSSPRE